MRLRLRLIGRFELQQKAAHQISGVMGTAAKAVDGLAGMLNKIGGLL